MLDDVGVLSAILETREDRVGGFGVGLALLSCPGASQGAGRGVAAIDESLDLPRFNTK